MTDKYNRPQFELWAEKDALEFDIYLDHALDKWGNYINDYENTAWYAWKASRDLLGSEN